VIETKLASPASAPSLTSWRARAEKSSPAIKDVAFIQLGGTQGHRSHAKKPRQGGSICCR
jgi:hypothetical protein